MIPRVAGSGRSFDGAGMYYLHDKLEDQQRLSTDADRLGDYTLHDKHDRQTSFRVGFTETLNMDAESPAQAIQQMSASYERYRERERNKRGRKLEKPVYAYSLAWAPDQTPSKEEMLKAAHSSLKALNLENLQTLIVQHTDEPHPHVHVIVNRIELHGKSARNIYRDHLAFSRWAEQYERDHGGIRCEQRVENNARRDRGEFVRDTVSLTPSEYRARENVRKEHKPPPMLTAADTMRMLDPEARLQQLNFRHHAERLHMEARTERRVADDRATANAKFTPEWARLYRTQAIQRQILNVANRGGIFERACFVMANREFLRKGGRLGLREIAKFALSSKALTKRVERVHTLERSELGKWMVRLANTAERIARREHIEEMVKVRGRQRQEYDSQFQACVIEREMEAAARRREKVEARAAAQAHAERHAQPVPEPPATPIPELRPGNSLHVADAGNFLKDPSPLKEEFQRSADPVPEPSRSEELLRRMEEYRRTHPKRDMGRRRRH
jgi:hypothetical protein